jgi:hypothetical protein
VPMTLACGVQEIRTALEIHAFDSGSEQGEAAPDSIEASFPSVLPSAGRCVSGPVAIVYMRTGQNRWREWLHA